jgi:hypothetical protein
VILATRFTRHSDVVGHKLECSRQTPLTFGSGNDAGKAFDMIKTFSISALFFLTLGVLAATHAELPF